MIKKPVNGMRDILPKEMEIRDYVIALAKETYKAYGFTPMETPCVESIENLLGKNGGENEKLTFKILKRGEKLKIEETSTENDLADSGLRYDLTMPLSRFYACHEAELNKPFKALQIGPVWRAERPQKGRFRQFYQCDIDILGDNTNLAEIELILATSTLLTKIGFTDFIIRVNDRRILSAIAEKSGVTPDRYEEVFIALDKLDKIGAEGVSEELKALGMTKEAVAVYLDFFAGFCGKNNDEAFAYLRSMLPEKTEIIDNLAEIFTAVNVSKKEGFTLAYDPTLVRGMGYYTGPIFEIQSPEFSSSIGGGGRYDEMIGKFAGTPTPACGFSIGFERIISILTEANFKVPAGNGKIAFLLEKGLSGGKLAEAFKLADAERANGKWVRIDRMMKNKKFQKEQLMNEGFTEIREFYIHPLG